MGEMIRGGQEGGRAALAYAGWGKGGGVRGGEEGQERREPGPRLCPGRAAWRESARKTHARASSFTLFISSNLMARQDLADLGIGPDGAVVAEGGAPSAATAAQPTTAPPPPPTANAARKAGGFVAGVRPTKREG